MAEPGFSGKWQMHRWYPNTDDSAEEVSKYQLVAHQKGNDVVLQSIKVDGQGYLLIRLRIDGKLATGSWHESTAADGPFKGANYSGAGQMLISEDGQSIEGMWAGAGFDHTLDKPRIYTGRWELKKL